MTVDPAVAKIANNPKYRELVQKRSSFAWLLTAIMLVIYYGFIFVIAYAPSFLGTPITEGGVTTIGLPIGVAVILSAIILTGIYVRRANGEFDDLTRQLIQESK
jgi:uncharacterized membrane protein (DUF485 family)